MLLHHHPGGHPVLLKTRNLAFLASIAVVGSVNTIAWADDCCDCECPEGEGPSTGKVTITVSYRSYEDSETCREYEFEGSADACWPTLNAGGLLSTIDLSNHECGTPEEADYNDSNETGEWGLIYGTPGCTNLFERDPPRLIGSFTAAYDDGTWSWSLAHSTDPNWVSSGCDWLYGGSFTGGDCTGGTWTTAVSGPQPTSGSTITVSISVSGGGCVPIDSGKTCADGDPDDCCPEEGGGSQAAETCPETGAPISLVTGHKVERSTDLVVSLPGRDYALTREYTSDPNFYQTDSSGDYFWNGGYGTVMPGRAGAGWDINGEQFLQGVSLDSGLPDRMYFRGPSVQSPKRFDLIDDVPPTWVERGTANSWIRDGGNGTVYRRVASDPGPGFETDDSSAPVLWMSRPGGTTLVSFVGHVSGALTTDTFEAGDLMGKIVSERDQHGNTWYYEWSSLGELGSSNRDVVRLRAIYLNGAPGSELARVEFHWHGDPSAGHGYDDTLAADARFGRLGMVEVLREDGVGEVVTNTVEYIYFDDIADDTIGGETIELGDVYDGSPGDLVEVVASTLMTDETMHHRVWQYRYYSTDNNALGGDYEDLDPIELNGRDHQLMAVVYPEQMEYYADYLMQEAERQDATSGTFLGDDTTGLFSTYFGSGFASVRNAAALLRWVRFDNTTVGHSHPDAQAMLLPNDRWKSLYDIAGKIVSYYPDSSPGGEDGRVMTQLVSSGNGQAGCGCSGGTTASNLGTRFDYVYRRYILPTGVAGPLGPGQNSNGYSAQVIESTLSFSGATLVSTPYRVECHDFLWPSELDPGDIAVGGDPGSRAGMVKLVTATVPADPTWEEISDPVGGSGNRWATVYEYDLETDPTSGLFTSYRKLTKKYTPASVSAYVPAGQADAEDPPTWTISATQGLVHHYDYTSGGGWADGYGISEGSGGTVIPQTEYTRHASIRPDLVTQSERNPGAGPTSDTPVETTTITRGFHGGTDGAPPSGQEADAVVAWERVRRTAETVAQNGPSGTVDYSTWQLWDTKGQLRWTRDELGTLTFMAYDDKTGALIQRVSDAKPDGDYSEDFEDVELNDTDFPGLTVGNGWSVPTRSDYAELVETMTVDLLGRVTKHTGPDGVSSYTRYETQVVDRSNDDADGMVSRGIPYQATLSFPHGYQVGMAYRFNGPITLRISNAAGKTVLTEQYVAEPDPGYDPADNEYAPGDLVARSEQEFLLSGATAHARQWHDVSATPENGSYITSYEYDLLGRALSVTDPEGGIILYGTVAESGYDILDRVIQVSEGWADDTGSITLISKTFYDSPQDATQGIGNGNVTRVETYTGEASNGTRVTKRWYDFRDRLVAEAPPALPNTVYAHDDLGRVVEQASFITNTGFTGGVSSLPAPSDASANRSTYAQTLYNNRGMVYRSRMAIDPEEDTSPEYLESNRWYDARGLVIAEWSPNGPGSKTAYDALGRVTAAYVTDRFDDALPGASGNHADASSVEDDRVIEQTEYAYVAADLENGPIPGTGQAELITHRMRLHDTTDDDALDGTNSVATYTLYEFDDASRAFKTHAYGTNNTDFKKGTSAPNRLSTGDPFTTGALTSEVDFDLWGRQILSISPEGKKTFSVLDALSRQIAAVEGQAEVTAAHITAGTGTWTVNWNAAYSGTSGVAPADADRVTTFFYDGLGNVTNRTAHIGDGTGSGAGSKQETRYIYGVDDESSPSSPTDSLVSSSRLLALVHYPNESTGAADTGSAYTVTYGYNRLGELRGMADQNGTTHAYTRDLLGRVTLDDVTAFGTNIDQAVHAIETAYDAHGRVASVVSLDSGDDPVNGVEFGFTPLHQIDTLTQHVSYTSGTPDVTGVVSYAYADEPAASGSTGNFSRVASITYPNEQGGAATVEYVYGSAGSIDDRIGRVAGMDVPDWTTAGDRLVDYTYLGASTPVRVHYPTTTHGLGLDAIKARSGVDGAATGHYPGFDKFGRVVHHAWVTDGFTTGSGGNPDRTPLLARAYDYDMDSNRELDYDARPGGAGAVRNDRDWAYLYDGLDRLKRADRGRESGGFTPAANSQLWDLDVLGNWKTVWTDTDGDAFDDANFDDVPDDIFPERENRTHNRANEITLQERPDGMSSQVITQPVYDDAGNYAHSLSSTTARLTYTHDAWNRLVKVFKGTYANPGHTVLVNEFNGLNHRIKRRMDLSQGAYDGVDEARTYFYSANWQVLEEWIDTDLDDDTDRIGQQFWGVRYIDDAVARRVDRDGDGTFSGDPEDNFFYLTDVMFSVRAIVDGTGLLHTRLDYTPYGVAMHGFAADLDGDGVVDSDDVNVFLANYNSGTPLEPGDTGYDPDADLYGKGLGSVFFPEYTPFLSRYNAYSSGGSNPTFNDGWIDNPGDVNGPDNSVGYDGYWFDLAGATEATSSGLYMVRHRVYDPRLGRWLQRDPAGYVDGQNHLVYVESSPTVKLDPTGLSAKYKPKLVMGPETGRKNHQSGVVQKTHINNASGIAHFVGVAVNTFYDTTSSGWVRASTVGWEYGSSARYGSHLTIPPGSMFMDPTDPFLYIHNKVTERGGLSRGIKIGCTPSGNAVQEISVSPPTFVTKTWGAGGMFSFEVRQTWTVTGGGDSITITLDHSATWTQTLPGISIGSGASISFKQTRTATATGNVASWTFECECEETAEE
jgi:RHS repeat-associated protein